MGDLCGVMLLCLFWVAYMGLVCDSVVVQVSCRGFRTFGLLLCRLLLWVAVLGCLCCRGWFD